MGRLHLFNPENDLALASNLEHYTPPMAGVQLRSSGALLPAWWACEDDMILAPADMADCLARLKKQYGLNGEIFTPGRERECLSAIPWGWSLDARSRFRSCGISDDILPSEAQLAAMRNVSHRRTTIKVLKALGCELPVETDNVDHVVSLAMQLPRYVKSPWSSSGRGVFATSRLDEESIRLRVKGYVARQGSVIVEPAYNKLNDFAALFYSDGSVVEFKGLSYFFTSGSGAYEGNLAFDDRWISECLGIDPHPYIERLCDVLSRIVSPVYMGWFGVDMLTYRDGSGDLRIHPCVEINLRMTMGVVARFVREKLGRNGIMRVMRGCSPKGAINLVPPGFPFSVSYEFKDAI